MDFLSPNEARSEKAIRWTSAANLLNITEALYG
jgi:hypothetical protein